jgi:phosphoribosylaminoimidazole-succinocarboxamide synthase
MGQTGSQAMPNEYSLVRELPNGSVVRQAGSGQLHFLKEYSFTNQESYQQAFVNFSKKLPEKHQHILFLERTNTKLENTFCSTFYKISLLYEYLEHTLQQEIA